jgi:tRNA dimethylallyltransferase
MAAKLLVLAGATAVGKTRIALELARRFDGELVGADSVQVYRGFDIGSSKPTAAELGGVTHHLIDVRDAEEPLDAAGYAALADASIADIRARGRVPIVVGGTGLWLRALLRGLVDAPPVDPALRARLEAEWDAAGSGAMHARLAALDPLSAARIHEHDKLRVVRALEVYQQTGRPLGAARAAHALGAPRYPALTFAIELPKDEHRRLVAARVQAMLEAGLVAEVERLIAKHGSEVRPLRSVGYKQIVEHLQLGVPLAVSARAIERATLLYARRQRTWWSTDPSRDRYVAPPAFEDAALLDEIARFIR